MLPHRIVPRVHQTQGEPRRQIDKALFTLAMKLIHCISLAITMLNYRRPRRIATATTSVKNPEAGLCKSWRNFR
jgi:hypothetical protein